MNIMGNKLLNKELEESDQKYLWHPFTQMKEWEEEAPLIIESAEGSYLTDIYGRRYIDGVSSLWVNVHGHKKKEIDLAIKNQLNKVAHSTLLGLSNVPAANLAKKLVDIAPNGLTRVFYSDSGSTAVEIALKMSFQSRQLMGQTSKTKFIALKEAYHGDTVGAVSVGGMDLFHKIFKPLLFDAIRVMAPFCYHCEKKLTYPSCNLACLSDVEEKMEKHHETVAALIMEPLVQGAAGMITHPEGYLKGVRDLCNKYDIHLILDEVATGFGRTGQMFASMNEKVSPDLMTVAKGITGGYMPLAATITTEEIYNAFKGEFSDCKTFFHGHTYTGNPLACAAALANIELFEKEATIETLSVKIDYLFKKLERFRSLSHIGDIRQNGFMVGLELIKNKTKKTEYPEEDRMGHKVIIEARKRGVIIRPLGNVVVLMPPLSISNEEIDILVDVVFESVQSVTEGSGDR